MFSTVSAMMFAAWNCRSGGGKKVDRLEAEGVDVAVICEAPLANPRSGPTLTGNELSWASIGEWPTKSLAVAGISTTFISHPRGGRDRRWAVAVDTDRGPSVLGVWSCPARSGGSAYAQEVIAILEAHAEWIATGDVIVAGDFNVGQALTAPDYRDWAAPVQKCWEALGLVSVYHSFHGEPVGAATRATYYHRAKADEAFHIDYVLIHRDRLPGVRDVAIGAFDTWVGSGLSDHVPIFVNLDW